MTNKAKKRLKELANELGISQRGAANVLRQRRAQHEEERALAETVLQKTESEAEGKKDDDG
jgi:hypothetical protein